MEAVRVLCGIGIWDCWCDVVDCKVGELMELQLGKNLRRIERKVSTGWQVVRMFELADGDIFRMFEFENEQVTDPDGRYEWIVIGAPYETKGGVWTVEVKGE